MPWILQDSKHLKRYIAYEDRLSLWSHLFFEGIFFWWSLNFECLILEIDRKHNLWAFAIWCFTLWFHNFIKKLGKRKKEDDIFLKRKNNRKTKQCCYNDTCRLKKDSFLSEVEISKEIVWINIFKKRILWNI